MSLDSCPADAPYVMELAGDHCTSELAASVQRLVGIFACQGSPANYLTTVARESRIPVIIHPDEGLDGLEDGQEITLDADQGLI